MSEKSEKFIAHLWKLDRKAFAELRRSLGDAPGQTMKAIPYVEPFAATEKTSWNSQMYYLVAGLFCMVERPLEQAVQPSSSKDNLGASIAKLYVGRERSGSIEKRFVTLLDADDKQLFDRLRQMVSLLCADGIAISWERLLNDLCYWHTDDRTVQHAWAKSFYLNSQEISETKEMTLTATGGAQ
jgi:CRISPR system Cascade subunit CasB